MISDQLHQARDRRVNLMIPATAAVLGERSRQVWLGFNLQSTWIRPSVKAAEGKFCYFVGLLSFDAEHDFPIGLTEALL